MKVRTYLGFLVIAGLLAAAGCSSSSPPPTTTTGPGGQQVTVSLVAQGLGFDKSSISVPAGASVTINFNNKDTGIPHNFALYTSGSASGTASGPLFVGPTINGPATISYTFTAPSQPGTYFFRCDTHPTTMTGSFIVT